MPVADVSGAGAAVRRQTPLRTTHLLEDEERVGDAETPLAKAAPAVDACWQPIELVSITSTPHTLRSPSTWPPRFVSSTEAEAG